MSQVKGTIKVNPFHLDDAAGALYKLGTEVTASNTEIATTIEGDVFGMFGEHTAAQAAADSYVTIVTYLSDLETALVECGDRLREASSAYQGTDNWNHRVFGPGEGPSRT